MAIETYSIAGDFTALVAAVPDLDALGFAVEADATITTTYLGSELEVDVFGFHFVTALSAPEKTALDGIVAAHTGTAPLAQGGTQPHGASETESPSAINDSEQGFSAGSIWVDEVVPEAYVLLDPTPGAANWQRVGDATGVDFSKVLVRRTDGMIVVDRTQGEMVTRR